MRVFRKFDTLNFNEMFLFEKYLLFSRAKKNDAKLKYVNKYLYAINQDLNIQVEDSKYSFPIWQLWLQGEDKMPPIVKFCTQSIKEQNPERNIILLTSDSLEQYVKLPDYIINKYQQGLITHTHFSDIVRTILLYKYGGTWIDSTVYMTGAMPDFIKNSDFFVFKDLTASLINENTTLEQFILLNNKMNFGAYTNSVSFIHSKAGNKLLGNLLKLFFEYWKYETNLYDYLLISLFITLIIFNDVDSKKEFLSAPYKLTTVEYGCLQQCLYEPFDNTLFENIKKLTPIHKLIYKNQDKNICKDSFFNYFVGQLK